MSRLNTTKPPLEDFVPAYVPTPEEVRAQKKREQGTEVGVVQGLKDVANADWIGSWAMRQLDAGSVGRYDPEFSVTDPRHWDRLTEGLDPAYHEMFGEATNIDMAMKIRQQALSIQQSNQNIASMGGKGIAVRIAGNVLDPVNIALGLVTGGGGFLARNASRAERLVRGGAFTVAAAAPTEIYRTVRDPLQDTEDFMLNMGIAFSIGGIANAIPQTVRAQQAVRAGTATVEETPTSFIIRQKQLTESLPRIREPGLEVWQRPMSGRDFINHANHPTRWNDVEVPKVKDIDFRPETADEATRYGQNVPMRSAGNSPILPTSRRQLAFPEINGVPDTTQTGQPLAPGSPIGQVGVQAPDGAGSQGSLGGTGSQPQRSQLPTPRKAGPSEYTQADAQRRVKEAVENNDAALAVREQTHHNINEGAEREPRFTFFTRKSYNDFAQYVDGDKRLLRLVRLKEYSDNQNVISSLPFEVGRGDSAEDFIGTLPGGMDEFVALAKKVFYEDDELEKVVQRNLSQDPAARFAFWFRDNYIAPGRKQRSLPDFDTWNQQKILGPGKKAYLALTPEQRKQKYDIAFAERERQRNTFVKFGAAKKEIIDSPATSLPDGTVFKIHDQSFEVVQNQYGEMTMVQRNPDGTEMDGKPLSVELAALDELPIDAGTLRTIRDPAPKVEYPSVDEMLSRVEATGIDPYADVIVDTHTGEVAPMADDIDLDTLMPRKKVVIDPETGEPMVDAVMAPDDLEDFVPPSGETRITVTAYRGQPAGQSPAQRVGGARFFSGSKSVAEMYAKTPGSVLIEEKLSFNKPLVTDNAGTLKKQLGLPARATTEESISAARAMGHDGIVLEKMIDGPEYIDLGSTIPDPRTPKQPWAMTRRGEGTDAFIGTNEDGAIAARIMNDEVGVRVAANPNGRSSEGVIRDNMAERLAAGTDPELSSRILDAVQKERNAVSRTKLLEGSFAKEDWQVPLSILKERGDGIRQIEGHKLAVEKAIRAGKPVPPEVLADYPDLQPNATPDIPDPRTLEERLTSKIDEINARRKNSPGVPRGDNTGGTILFAEMVDLVHEMALRAIRAGVRGADELGKIFDELTAGKDPEIQKVRKDIIAQADGLAAEPELIEAKYRIAKVRAEKADEIRGAKSGATKPAASSAPKGATAGNTPPPPTENPPGVGGTPKGPSEFDLAGREYKGDATPDPAFGKVRFSMSKALQSSSSQFARWLGKVTGETAVMSKGWFDNAAEKFGDSASEATDRVFRSKITRLVAATEPMWKQYAKRENLSFIERAIRDKFKDEFNDKVGIAIRAGRSDDPIIEAARKAYASHFKDLLEYGKKYGLPGFDKIPPDETYLWRAWDNSKIAKMTAMHKHASLVELLTKAARNKNQDLDEAATREVMGYFLNALHNRQYGLDLDKNLAFTSARDTVESVIDALGLERNKAQDLINRAKGRMILDENASIETAAGTLRLSDLLDNNAETLAHVYARNVVGASHMQEVFRAAEGHWGRKVESLAELLDLIRRDGAAVGADKTRLEYDISKAKAIGEAILGHRSAAPTFWTKASIAVRGINHLARSGSFAFAQIPEAGRVIAGGGIQAAINNMPVMKDILTSIYSGTPDTRLLQEIQDIWALGTEPLVNHPVRRFDFREAGDQFLNYSQFNRQLNKAQYWASNLSGMTYIQNVQQKWAGAAFVNTWANMKVLPSKARLTTLGMDEAMAQKIIDNIKQHGTTETGPLGVRVKRLNIEKWDKDVASAFVVAGDKWTRNAVQQNNIALYSEWMTSDAGKVLTQFRAFVINGYEKQFLQPGQILIASRGKDFEAWMSFMVPAFLGGLAYVTQTHINSVGRADRDKYLKDMLSDEKIALGAFNRGGAASILPIATDYVAGSFGYDRPFSYARSSGLENDPLAGNPTFDVLYNTMKSPRMLRAAFDPDYNATQSDMRNLRKIIPGQNLPVVKNILDYYQTRLPKERYQR